LILGAGTAAGYVWAIVEQGNYNKYRIISENYSALDSRYTDPQKEYTKKRDGSLVRSILGIVGGSLCLIGLEIVAFF
jgi:hypothetical protein